LSFRRGTLTNIGCFESKYVYTLKINKKLMAYSTLSKVYENKA